MQPVKIGIIGLGNVGSGALDILAGNAAAIEKKLGFPLKVVAVCSRGIQTKQLPPAFDGAFRTTSWEEVVNHPDVQIVAELIGGTTTARDILEAAILKGKPVVTANKELMALSGGDLWRKSEPRVHFAMEASVAGGIPIHAVLREGIAADRITTLYGILNGTCNYILTEIEENATSFDAVLAAAQREGVCGGRSIR